MRNIFAIAMKDLRLLWRDKVGLFWVIGFPLVMALFFGSIFGGGGDGPEPLSIVVLDEDGTDASAAFVAQLESSEAIALRPLRAQGNASPDERTDLEIARDRVRRGNLVAYVVIPEGFGGASLFSGTAPVLEVGIDPTRTAERGYLKGMLTAASFQRLQDAFADPAMMREQLEDSIGSVDGWDLPEAQKETFRNFFGDLDTFLEDADTEALEEGGPGGMQPVTIVESEVIARSDGPATAFEVSFPQAMMWGLIGAAAGFALTLVRERKEGTLLRLRVAPHPMWHVLAGKGLARFITCAAALLLLTLIAVVAFQMRILSVPLYALAVVSTSLCFVGIMMAMTTLGKTEEAVAGIAWGVMLLMSMIGGGMVPLMFMPGWLQNLSMVSPVKWAIFSIEGAVWRGFSTSEMLVPCGILVAIGVAAFTVGALVFRRTDG